MLLVSVNAYKVFTKDVATTSSAVSAAIEEATGVWEEYLDRWLVNGEYTETVNVDKRGRVFPKAVPVTSAPDGYTIWAGGNELIGASPTFPPGYWPSYEDPLTVEITYTGGYDQLTCPRTIRQNILRTANKIVNPVLSSIAGVTTVKVGDLSASYDEPIAGFDNIDKAQIKQMRPYMRRHL